MTVDVRRAEVVFVSVVDFSPLYQPRSMLTEVVIAIVIQSVVRGSLERAKLSRSQSSDAIDTKGEYEHLKNIKRSSSDPFQRVYTQDEEKAAIKIQSVVRGTLTRSHFSVA